MGIGQRIKEARVNKKLTQEQLAALLNVSKGTVGNYEAEISHPKEPIMYKLFDVLEVDANFLFQDEMQKEKPSDEIIKGLSINEAEIITAYRKASPEIQAAVRGALEAAEKDRLSRGSSAKDE